MDLWKAPPVHFISAYEEEKNGSECYSEVEEDKDCKNICYLFVGHQHCNQTKGIFVWLIWHIIGVQVVECRSRDRELKRLYNTYLALNSPPKQPIRFRMPY